MMTQSHGSNQLERILMTSPGTSCEDGRARHVPPLNTSPVVSYSVTYAHSPSADIDVSTDGHTGCEVQMLIAFNL